MSETVKAIATAADHTEVIITILIGVAGCIPWLIGLTAWFVRLSMRVKTLEEKHTVCAAERKVREDSISKGLQEIKETLSALVNDIGWLKEERKKNGKS